MSAFIPQTVLVTGGAGFIGSNFVRWVLTNDPTVAVVNLDLLTYAGNLENLGDVEQRFGSRSVCRYVFVHGDIRDIDLVIHLLRGDAVTDASKGRSLPPINTLVHFAAESHVDRSIMTPASFIDTNVRGTVALLEAVRTERSQRDGTQPFRFLHVSTDEVYGSLGAGDPPFTEESPLAPNSPYSASKAAADLLVRSYFETLGVPTVITRCSNNYGSYQFPEKLIPLMITRALRDEPVPVYGDGGNVRDWIHVDDHVEALWCVLCRGKVGRVYNIGGEAEIPNIDIVRRLLTLLGKPESLIRFVPDRPAHDRRYAMDISRMRRELNWSPRHSLETGLIETVAWYRSHREWWERLLREAYRAASEMYLPPPSGTLGEGHW